MSYKHISLLFASMGALGLYFFASVQHKEKDLVETTVHKDTEHIEIVYPKNTKKYLEDRRSQE